MGSFISPYSNHQKLSIKSFLELYCVPYRKEIIMINISNYCKMRYYNQYDSKQLLHQVQGKIDKNINHLSYEMLYVFWQMLNIDPCSYWKSSVFLQTYSILESLYKSHSQQINVDETIFGNYLTGYYSYVHLSKIILDLRNFNITQETKTQLYRLPTYISIIEGCISNFMRVIVAFTGQALGKDYTSQGKLGALVQIAKSNGYSEIVSNVNVNIRNAINHGRVQVMRKSTGSDLCFYYVENNILKKLEMAFYQFDNIIDDTFDTASAVLLAISVFINNHIDVLKIDESKRKYIQFSLLSMKLSLPGLICYNISDTGNNKQLNIEFEVNNTDRSYLGQISVLLANLVYEKYAGYEQYMFGFSNPRMINGWVRFTNQEILDMTTGNRSFDTVMQGVVDRKDCIIFDSSSEEIDLNEVKYFCFPNIKTDTYKINNVQDASVEDRKRLRAHLYVGDEDDKQKLLTIFNEAIEKLKGLKNPPSPTIYQKNGLMDADSLYINVYRIDTRKSKELFPNNDNFVCMLDYNSNGITTLLNGGIPVSIWNQLHHETIGNLKIAWREGKFAVRRKAEKIGRNAICSCGSGKKCKKCCGK